jgi:hypothetical protein
VYGHFISVYDRIEVIYDVIRYPRKRAQTVNVFCVLIGWFYCYAIVILRSSTSTSIVLVPLL